MGIGGGVMLNVMRIVFYVQVGILFLNMILSGTQFFIFFKCENKN